MTRFLFTVDDALAEVVIALAIKEELKVLNEKYGKEIVQKAFDEGIDILVVIPKTKNPFYTHTNRIAKNLEKELVGLEVEYCLLRSKYKKLNSAARRLSNYELHSLEDIVNEIVKVANDKITGEKNGNIN